MTRLYQIDSLKLLCAVLVVFIHTVTPYKADILPLTRCAVPCFFIISGYLIFSPDAARLDGHLRRSSLRMLKILGWSTALFAAVKLAFALRSGDFSFLSWRAMAAFVALNENPFAGHLWYVGAYLYVLLIVRGCLRLHALPTLFYAIPLLLLLDLCFGKYSIALWGREFPYVYVRNFLCVGLPFVGIGMLLKKHKDKILSTSRLQALTTGGGNFICLNVLR